MKFSKEEYSNLCCTILTNYHKNFMVEIDFGERIFVAYSDSISVAMCQAGVEISKMCNVRKLGSIFIREWDVNREMYITKEVKDDSSKY